jgi:hypothetical protein
MVVLFHFWDANTSHKIWCFPIGILVALLRRESSQIREIANSSKNDPDFRDAVQ